MQKIVAISRQVTFGLMVGAGLVASSHHAAAQLIAYEGFDYSEGLLTDILSPGDNNGGTGWIGAWEPRDTEPINEVVAAGLTYSDGTNDLAVTGGSNYTTAEGSGLSMRYFDVTTTLDSSLYFQNDAGTNMLGVPQTTVWFSFLLKTDVSPPSGSVFTQLFEGPFPGGTDSSRRDGRERTAAMGAIHQGGTGDAGQWGFFDLNNEEGGSGFSDVALGDNMGDLVTTNTVFYVARIDYGGNVGDDPYDNSLVSTTVNIWLNPALDTEPLLADADGMNINATTGVVFNGIGMGGEAGNWDEFRFGTTYASVAPIAGPPPIDGDFDLDRDVDGADFLRWQQDMSVGSLSDWEANYGRTSSLLAAATVPEPASTSLAMMVALSVVGWARRRRSVNG